MDNQNKAYLYAISAVLIWSTVASAFKLSLKYLDFLQLLFLSSIASIIILFIILVIQKKIHLATSCTPGEYLRSALLGFLNPFLYYIILFKAYSLLLAQEAQPLNYTWPITLSILSIPLLKQRIRFRNILAIIISFIGVLFISTRGDFRTFRFSNPLGVSLAIGSSFVWALYWIFNLKDKRDVVVKLFLNFCFGFVFILVATMLFSNATVINKFSLLGAAYVGLFEMGITFVLWLKALSLSKTTAKVSNLIFLSPFVSLIFIKIIVGERILISTVVGLAFIVGGIFIQYSKNQKP